METLGTVFDWVAFFSGLFCLLYWRNPFGLVVMLVMGWFLWADAAEASCDNPRGFWALAGEERTEGGADVGTEHNYGTVTNSVEVTAGKLAIVHESMTMAAQLDPRETCSAIPARITYSLGVTQNPGGWLSGAASCFSIGSYGKCNNSPAFVPAIDEESVNVSIGPGSSFKVELGGYLTGWSRATVSKLPIAPARMSDYLKKRYLTTGKIEKLLADLTIAGASAIPNKLYSVMVRLFGIAMRANAQQFIDVATKDPWRAKYAQAYVVTLPAVPAEVRGALWREWYKNLVALTANARAIEISSDRANTAMALAGLGTPGAAVAEDARQADLERFTRKVARLARNEVRLRLLIQRKLDALGYDVPVADLELLAELNALAAAVL